MINNARIAGGILAVVGGAIALDQSLYTLNIAPLAAFNVYLMLILGIMALCGGVLLCADKGVGGILPLASGSIGIFIVIFGSEISYYETILSVPMPTYFLDLIFMAMGGIIGLVARSKFET